ncbi:MAG TPA: hypothetical protein VFC63_04900 [Blastocatellia bacterium]|nr:hypothetical protein [Blastocatellia bacterium]
MGSATLAGILQRVEATQTVTKDRRIPWVAVTVAGIAITLCFIYGCWQHFAAMQFNYENQKWEVKRRELVEQRERLMLERSTKQSDRKLLTDATKLGMITHASALALIPAASSTRPTGERPTGGGAPND